MNLKEEFLNELKVIGFSRYTTINYSSDISKLEKNGLENIEYNNLRNIVLETLGNIPNLRSRSRALSCYKSFSRWLYDNEYTDKDTLKSLKSIKVPKVLLKIPKIQKRPIHSEFKSKNSLYQTIIDTLEQTGVRVGELSRLTLGNLKEESIIVFGKGSKEREIPCNKKLVLDIQRELGIHKHFPSTSQIFRIVKKYLGVSPHKLRHNFAKKLAASGANGFTIMQLLGHSSISTSQIYINLANDKSLKKAVEKANERT